MGNTDSQLSCEYVGFWARLGAAVVDSILVSLIAVPLLYTIYGQQYWGNEAFIQGLPDFIISWVFPLVATILFWIYKSATPGKMVLKAKIVDAKTGNQPTPKQSLVRYMGYYVSLLPLFLGFLWIAWDPKKQGWHDKLAGTLVVKVK